MPFRESHRAPSCRRSSALRSARLQKMCCGSRQDLQSRDKSTAAVALVFGQSGPNLCKIKYMYCVPTTLYKYLPAGRTLDVLGKLLIRFSQASVMNDALEFKPSLKGVASRPKLETVLIERLRLKFPGVVERVEATLPPNIAEQLIRDVISKGAVQAEGSFAKSVEAIYGKLDHNFGILSLSETPTDTLMWSHYADGGRGFLIEFDPSHSWFWAKKTEEDDFRHLARVAYSSSRPPKYLLETSGIEFLYTKGQDWEHEKEWRVIRNFNDAALKAGSDDNGKDVLLFAIPPECILSVVAGYRATPESVTQLRETLATTPSLSHVGFNHAMLESGGSIDIVPGV